MDACFEVKKKRGEKKIRIRVNGVWYLIFVNLEKRSRSKLITDKEVESYTTVFGSPVFEVESGASILVTEDNDSKYISIWVLNSSCPTHFQEV